MGLRLCQILKDHQIRSLLINPEDLIFPGKKGKPMSAPYLLQEVLQPAAEAAGIGHVTWHQFRHIHSSLLHDQGTPIKVAQEQLGHANLSTTEKIYTHVVPETHRAAIESLEGLLFPNVPKFDESRNRAEFVN